MAKKKTAKTPEEKELAKNAKAEKELARKIAKEKKEEQKEMKVELGAMKERRAEINKLNSGAYKTLNEAKALTEGRYKAAARLAETEKALYDLYIKNNTIVSDEFIKAKAKRITKKAVKKDKLGLTQGDKLWGKEGIKSRASKMGEFALHTAGMATENPIFNLGANALSKRRNRVSEARQGVYSQERDERDQKKKQNRQQNEDQEAMETDTGSSKGTGNSDNGVDLTELVAEAKTSNKLLTALLVGDKEQIGLMTEYNENIEFSNNLAEEKLEDEELSQKSETANEHSPEKVEEKRGKKKELKRKDESMSASDMYVGALGLSKLVGLLGPTGPLVLGLAATAVAVGVLDKYLDQPDDEATALADEAIKNSSASQTEMMANTKFGTAERSAGIDQEMESLKQAEADIKKGDGMMDSLRLSKAENHEIKRIRDELAKLKEEQDRSNAELNGVDYAGDKKQYNHISEGAENSLETSLQHFESLIATHQHVADITEQELAEYNKKDPSHLKIKDYNKLALKKEQKDANLATAKGKMSDFKDSLSPEKLKEFNDLKAKKDARKLAADIKNGKVIAPVPKPEHEPEPVPKPEPVPEPKEIEAKVEAKAEAKAKVEEKKEAMPVPVKKVAEVVKAVEKVKAKPAPKVEPKLNFSAETSDIEERIRKKEDIELKDIKKVNGEMFHHRVEAMNKFGKDSDEYKEANGDFKASNKEYNALKSETLNNRNQREGNRRVDLGWLTPSEAAQNEANREHMKLKEDKQPIVVQAPASDGGGQQGSTDKNIIVANSGDDFSFGNNLNKNW